MRLSWHDLGTPRADRAHGKTLEVVGWPTASLGLTRSDYFVLTAEAFARMVDVIGVDHVGIGTDQMGLTGPSSMPSYGDLPQLAAALRRKFNDADVAKLLGGNYRRVFEARLA